MPLHLIIHLSIDMWGQELCSNAGFKNNSIRIKIYDLQQSL